MKKRKSNGTIKINPSPKVKAIAFKEVKKYTPLPDITYEHAKSPMKAIRNKCLYCCENSYNLVKECPSGGFEECSNFSKPKYRSEECKSCKVDEPDRYARCKAFSQGKLILCQLWPYRLGKNPFRERKEITEEHKAKLIAAAQKAREERKAKED